MTGLEKRLRLSLLHLEILRLADAADNDTQAEVLRRSACILARAAHEPEWPLVVVAGDAANDNGGSR